jgi:predicted RNase H-like HicB family nuclease
MTNESIIIRIDAPTVAWRVTYDNGGWLGYCNQLKLNSFGDTFSDLQECIGEAMELWLLSRADDGELEKEIVDRGWSMYGAMPTDEYERACVKFDLPWTIER